jgi:hypothetical protein
LLSSIVRTLLSSIVVGVILRHSVIDCFENLVQTLCGPCCRGYFGRLFLLPTMSPRQPPYVDPATYPAPANTPLALWSVK